MSVLFISLTYLHSVYLLTHFFRDKGGVPLLFDFRFVMVIHPSTGICVRGRNWRARDEVGHRVWVGPKSG